MSSITAVIDVEVDDIEQHKVDDYMAYAHRQTGLFGAICSGYARGFESARLARS